MTCKGSKQKPMTNSTCESIYIAGSEVKKEATWLKNFICDLIVVPSIQDLIEIFCDNKGVVALTKEHMDHGRSRHILKKYHYVIYRVEDGDIIANMVPSEENMVQPFTNALDKVKHFEHARSISMSDDIIFRS